MIAPEEILLTALRALRTNKIRSLLTVLGMIIGVAAVIAMFAVGTGAQVRITERFASMGSNLLVVFPGSSRSGGVRGGGGTLPTLTLEDAEAILRECPAVADVAPRVSGRTQVVYGNANWSTSTVGSTASLLSIRNWTLESGRNFTESDQRSAAKVCILGATVAAELFGGEDPLGKIVRVNKIPMTVVGLLAAKGSSAAGSDQDDMVLVPVTTAMKRLFGARFPGKIQDMTIQAKSAAEIAAAESQITDLLTRRHRIRPGEENDFTVRNLSEIMEAAQEGARIMSLLLAAVASVSLLVGGIGIMNIMLVSVTERTREIGIRAAVGARRADILLQFLAEALLLSLAGGILGICTGAGGAFLISHFADWPAVIAPESVALAFGFSAAIGVFFGFYPAWKASRLNPIEALRYE